MMPRHYNLDFNQPLTIDTRAQPWLDSPSKGVRRCPLEREEAESGHVTSLVEYLPGAHFSAHPHPGGEEILVLSGIFSDENGDFGPGTYLRNPPGTLHAPFSRQGCTLLVKLNQFQAGDRTSLAIDTRPWQCEPGLPVELPLHRFGREYTALLRLPQGADTCLPCLDGQVEAVVLAGTLLDQRGRYRAGTWLRRPNWHADKLMTAEDTVLFIKQGHFPTRSF
ncbi:cupin domain-containing protein [Gallaecimonas xiamenensis]|uniref:Anti-ECFsigma factor ChrR n=1 Tax=Gallaecimonas xiamenensis 3-C-1 TaxID=745411 RepID=K2K6L8_9GAMM|nr:cupin domain-containing protein [Gallaecimonas xiamenensis]EKE73060.1 anti-ECFsigma factor ChrR [Gallaecimonas xiamenensis 3-C-1]